MAELATRRPAAVPRLRGETAKAWEHYGSAMVGTIGEPADSQTDGFPVREFLRARVARPYYHCKFANARRQTMSRIGTR